MSVCIYATMFYALYTLLCYTCIHETWQGERVRVPGACMCACAGLISHRKSEVSARFPSRKRKRKRKKEKKRRVNRERGRERSWVEAACSGMKKNTIHEVGCIRCPEGWTFEIGRM